MDAVVLVVRLGDDVTELLCVLDTDKLSDDVSDDDLEKLAVLEGALRDAPPGRNQQQEQQKGRLRQVVEKHHGTVRAGVLLPRQCPHQRHRLLHQLQGQNNAQRPVQLVALRLGMAVEKPVAVRGQGERKPETGPHNKVCLVVVRLLMAHAGGREDGARPAGVGVKWASSQRETSWCAKLRAGAVAGIQRLRRAQESRPHGPKTLGRKIATSHASTTTSRRRAAGMHRPVCVRTARGVDISRSKRLKAASMCPCFHGFPPRGDARPVNVGHRRKVARAGCPQPAGVASGSPEFSGDAVSIVLVCC